MSRHNEFTVNIFEGKLLEEMEMVTGRLRKEYTNDVRLMTSAGRYDALKRMAKDRSSCSTKA